MAVRRVLEIIPTYTSAHYYLAIVFHSLGREKDSDAALAQMQKDYADKYAFGIAEVYAYRGEAEQALHWLDRAYVQKDSTLYMVKGEWPLRGLAGDSRYLAFLRKMNLPE
jgi:hypothetical protein